MKNDFYHEILRAQPIAKNRCKLQINITVTLSKTEKSRWFTYLQCAVYFLYKLNVFKYLFQKAMEENKIDLKEADKEILGTVDEKKTPTTTNQ